MVNSINEQSIHEWSRKHHNRITLRAEVIEAMTDKKEPPGIYIGYADKEEFVKDGKTLPKHL